LEKRDRHRAIRDTRGESKLAPQPVNAFNGVLSGIETYNSLRQTKGYSSETIVGAHERFEALGASWFK